MNALFIISMLFFLILVVAGILTLWLAKNAPVGEETEYGFVAAPGPVKQKKVTTLEGGKEYLLV